MNQYLLIVYGRLFSQASRLLVIGFAIPRRNGLSAVGSYHFPIFYIAQCFHVAHPH